MKTPILRKTIIKLLKTGHARNIKTLAERVHPADMANSLASLDQENIKQLFDHISDNKTIAKILSKMDDRRTASKALHVIKKERLAEIFSFINPDDSADIIGYLSSKDAQALLKLINKDTSSTLNELLKYPHNSSGGIMSTKFLIIDKESTVGSAIKELKNKGHNGSFLNIYIKNNKDEVCACVPISSIFSFPSDTPISKLMDEQITTIPINVHQSKVISIFNRYSLFEAPVVDKDGKMLGIITADNVSKIVEQEVSKDLLEISGSLPIKSTTWSRIPMLCVSFLLLLLSSYLIYNKLYFIDQPLLELLSFAPILVIFPSLMSVQSSISTSRDFDIGLIDLGDILGIIKLELKISILFGLAFCLLLFSGLSFYIPGTEKTHLILSIILFLNMVIASTLGGIFPFILRRKSSSYLPVSAQVIIPITTLICLISYMLISKYLLSINIIPDTWKIF